ncbi:c-type cytochrome [Thalassococcus sp. CAU 1522]|uniref:C-type cytochrome n=2 Tax=Thalassococcus arenae TaxID=2851652 RepID=A0ABS6N5Y0_9RHOB|nr:c-type cytochrome [Thalassococcus arenae]MBV2359426.1 c-type cytochrome [Thalassococcus arenae]
MIAAAFWIGCAAPLAAQDFATLKGHGGPIMDIAVAPDGTVASASFDNAVGLWSGSEPDWLEGHDAAVAAVAYLEPGVVLSGGDDFALWLWEGGTGTRLGAHKGKILDIATNPDGKTIATASWDGTIGLWEVDRQAASGSWKAARKDLTDHESGVNAVAFSEDGNRLYSASSDGTVRVWEDDGSTSRVLVSNGFAVTRVVVNETEGWLAYGAVDGVTRLVDVTSGAEIADFTLERRPILALAYHDASRQLAVGDGEGFIMIVDTDARRIVRDFRAAREGPVWALAFSPDGQTIYAGGLDDVVFAWPVALLDRFEPGIVGARSFLRDAETMPNGERQFMRKCSICHALEPGPSRKAGPTLHGVFGRRAGTVPGYRYSETLDGSDIVWSDATIDALFDIGPDHYIPGSKMPMQIIAGDEDRADLIAFLRSATKKE